MTCIILCVPGVKTESEFADIYLYFIRKYGIPSALRIDNAKSEMSQRVKDIHRDLIMLINGQNCIIGQVHQIIYGF
jgi:hypothetical protein